MENGEVAAIDGITSPELARLAFGTGRCRAAAVTRHELRDIEEINVAVIVEVSTGKRNAEAPDSRSPVGGAILVVRPRRARLGRLLRPPKKNTCFFRKLS